ncbi:transposable element Tcb2 transposase [Trichonephila clavipes]|uniref:Transposable element Tcb2 transposase n=1 Tax=Trichonephila clavipes TaxID=2585209 RepID=A0A8X6SU49_TRICX|nr:transposable element Tcb2 transposase [Trichonephila clavipes]
MLKSAHCVTPTGEIKEFKIDGVLINDEKFPRHFWKLGKVIDAFPGRDGKIRSLAFLLSSPHPSDRPRGERLNPAFALQRRIAPTAGVVVWGAIAYNTRSPLVLIRGTMIAQRYVHDILQPHVLLLMQRLSGAISQQDNARPHTARVSQDCLLVVTTFP